MYAGQRTIQWFQTLAQWCLSSSFNKLKWNDFDIVFFLSRPAFGRSAATRWRWSSQTASGSWPCPGRRCSGWTRHASVRWRTWPTSPASTRPPCCITSEKDTTRAWSMWVRDTRSSTLHVGCFNVTHWGQVASNVTGGAVRSLLTVRCQP